MVRLRALMLVCALMLAGCDAPDADKRARGDDPVMAEALESQLMVDPDLSQQNARNMVAVPGGPIDPNRPEPDPSASAQ